MKVKINKIGYTRLLYLRRVLRSWYTSFMLKFYPPFRTRFSDGVIKDGVDELLIERDSKEPLMKKVDGKWVQDDEDDGYESFWIVKY